MKTALSVDVEEDFPPYYKTYDGIEGLKFIAEKLREKKCNATFFVCAELLDKKPEVIDIMRGFEIGCHGLRHVNLAELTVFQVEGEIAEAVQVFKEHNVKAYGFRAPYCSASYNVLSVVRKYFEYDSSFQFYSFGRMPGIEEMPVFTGGKIFGIDPRLFSLTISYPLKNKVYFTHPWEYGGFDFAKVEGKRGKLKPLGYSKENYAINLNRLLEKGTCSVKELL